MISVHDFALRYAKIGNTRFLPLEKVEAVEDGCYLVTNRFGATSSVNKEALIALSTQYEKVLWDELIQLESQILFFTECKQASDSFKFLQGVGLVRKTDKKDIVTYENKPWETMTCNEDVLSEISEARLFQIEGKLTESEEQHEFVTQAIESLW